VFLPANIHKRDLHMLHYMAWKKGVKSLYYCRSASLQRSDKVSKKVPDIQLEMSLKTKQSTYEECLACQ
jgi:ribonucleoside-diphosphate reductase alpha chain